MVTPHKTIMCGWTSSGGVKCTNVHSESHTLEAAPIVLVGERLLAAQAMRSLMNLDRDLREARAQVNQDWFRRVMRARPKAVSRLRRRWAKIYAPPPIALGNIRRRYHANFAKYLYEPRGN